MHKYEFQTEFLSIFQPFYQQNTLAKGKTTFTVVGRKYTHRQFNIMFCIFACVQFNDGGKVIIIDQCMNSRRATGAKDKRINDNDVSAQILFTFSSPGFHFLARASLHCRCYKTARQGLFLRMVNTLCETCVCSETPPH